VGFTTLSIFGKASEANRCMNCGEFKTLIVNVNEELYLRYPKIWAWLNYILLDAVVFDSNTSDPNPKKEPVDVAEFVDVNDYKDFKFHLIQAAEEVEIDVNVHASKEQIKNFNLFVALNSVRVDSGKLNSEINREIVTEDLVVGAKQGEYGYKFDFYNMKDGHKTKRNELDGLVYDKVSVSVFLDGLSYSFAFFIKNYHEIIRYRIDIEKVGGKIHVKVTDADFQFKKDLYSIKEGHAK
jgi:hypothetical protein